MIELSAVIKDLRDELQSAIKVGKGEDLRFELGTIELEVTVAVDRSDDGGGKVRFWVVELGAKRRRDTANTQRIKLSLTPKLAGERRPPRISGRAEAGEE